VPVERKTDGLHLPVCLSLRQIVPRLVLIAAAYFLSHQLSFFYPDAQKVLMAVWPPGGIALAALLLNPRKLWPAILILLFLAGNAADLLAGRPPLASIGFMTANILESATCAWLLVRLCGEGVGFTRVREVLVLVLGATLVNACTGLMGAGAATLTSHASFWSFWKTWVIADGLGILLVAPLIVAWGGRRIVLKDIQWGRVLEAGAFLVVWCTVAWLTFDPHVSHALILEPFTLVALLTWCALRHSVRGVATATAVLVAIVMTSDAVVTGPLLWGGETLTERLLLAQAYAGVTAVTGLLLSASYTESRTAERISRENSARLATTAEALRVSREQLNSIVEGTPDVVFAKDSAGRYTLLNTAAARLIGKPAAEMIGQDETGFLASDEARVLMERDHAVMSSGMMSTSEDVLTTADGMRHTFQATRGPIHDGNGHVIGMFNIAREITERKGAEEELARYRDHLEEVIAQRTREMEAAREEARRAERLASLGTFAAGIAHEINNPLGIMLLGTDTALACMDKPEVVAQLLRQNKVEIERCARVVRGVLNFAREQPTEKHPLDLNEVVGYSVVFATEFSAKHGVKVETRLAKSLNPILGNAVELEQAVVNLVYNAVQACGGGGHVTIETQEVGDTVRLLVRDDGSGMTPEEVRRVFDPFYTTRLEKGGTGLGLSVVHGVVTSHKGSITVASEEGRGTTFTIEFGRHTGTEAADGKDTDR